MPKHPKNIRREAAKIVAGKLAVNDAVEKMQRGDSTAGVFWRVVRSLGFKSFVLADHTGTEVRGTAGHGGGKVIVTIGCIVLTSCPTPRVDGVEILAVIDTLKEAKRLVRLGVLHPSFIGEHEQSTSEAFVFAPSDDAVLGVLREIQPRSLKESRAEEVAQRSIDRRVHHIMRGGASASASASGATAVSDAEVSDDEDSEDSEDFVVPSVSLPPPAVGVAQATADQPVAPTARVVVAKAPQPPKLTLAQEAAAAAAAEARIREAIENDISAW